ncbi:MAG: hypothetical protein B7X90_07585 [Novosphingobium sp. 17-62-19]|uniref:hypothetical protein n=1 Tax=Novosphingobium sp. 17-62-19 TaxID=1970406 RepID=UPI000BD08F9D|nr:hypothetical protein [Novosphingobium sp. 17-62-19]OYX94676.1 MAG: hypothetical protein B7Y74_06420 [Novosphingobium sp. 35-62-5]OZA19831.1 MAG: hypothetical protein B7X90_07585 [Novosphingobium sp. 17-62-19]HQS95204.1 hypothetical protein [Novosphingobium sp.]
MLALVCSALFAATAAFAAISVFVTMHGRTGQIRALLAEYRALQRDREFLVQVTSHGSPAPRGVALAQPRRVNHRKNRSVVEAARSTQPLRAAA